MLRMWCGADCTNTCSACSAVCRMKNKTCLSVVRYCKAAVMSASKRNPVGFTVCCSHFGCGPLWEREQDLVTQTGSDHYVVPSLLVKL